MKYAELYNLEIVQIHNELPKAWKNLSYPNALSNSELLDMSWSGNAGYAFYPYTEIIPDSNDFYTLSAVVNVVDAVNKTVTGTRTANPISDINAWEIVRSMRNNELTATDWTQLPDSPLTTAKKAEWAVYRQELRDVTEQENPREIVWPTPVA
jgi:hypothetical protein